MDLRFLRNSILDGYIRRHVYVGDMINMSLLFLAQTVFFLGIGYLNLSERLYMYIFGAYLTVFMIGFTYYVTFLLEPGFAS